MNLKRTIVNNLRNLFVGSKCTSKLAMSLTSAQIHQAINYREPLPLNILKPSEFQSNICVIGRSTLRKTSLCKLFIDEALANQRPVYVISGGTQEDDYDSYRNRVNLKTYIPPIIISEKYNEYFESYVIKLLQDIETVAHSLIVVDEIDPWTKRLEILESFFAKAKSVEAQVICASQNHRPKQEFLKHFPILIVPRTASMKQERWGCHADFFSWIDEVSTVDNELQLFDVPDPTFQIRSLKLQ